MGPLLDFPCMAALTLLGGTDMLSGGRDPLPSGLAPERLGALDNWVPAGRVLLSPAHRSPAQWPPLRTEGSKELARSEDGFSHFRIMVLAGDTLPIEVYCHLPVMCEDRNLPYVYIPSKTVRGSLPQERGSGGGGYGSCKSQGVKKAWLALGPHCCSAVLCGHSCFLCWGLLLCVTGSCM